MAEDKAALSLSDLVHLSGEERMHKFMKVALEENQTPEGRVSLVMHILIFLEVFISMSRSELK